MSLTSLAIKEKGYNEIYPFASWKLFTVPSGGESLGERYKLYGIKQGDTIRIVNISRQGYDANDEELIVNTYGNMIESHKNRDIYIKKLMIFAKDIRPEFQEYLLYKEIYKPQQIGSKRMDIKKKIITKL